MSRSKPEDFYTKGLELPLVSDEEAEKIYNHSSLKWQWGKPYNKLTEGQKKAVKKIARIQKNQRLK